MSSNAYRPKSLVTAKYKSSTPISQPSSKHVKKRDSLRNGQDGDDLEFNDNLKNKDTTRQKSFRNYQGQQGLQNNYYTGQLLSNNTTGLLYFGGNIMGQNTSTSSKRIITASALNNQNSKEYNDKMMDEFSDLNFNKRHLQLNLEETGDDNCNSIPKKVKQSLNLKSLPNQQASLQSNTTPTASSNQQTKQMQGNRNKMGNNLQQNSIKCAQKGDKYISIKDTIAAYKDVEQKIIKKTNELSGRPPLLISTNNQMPVSSITPTSTVSQQIQQQQQQQLSSNQSNPLKHIYSDDILNVIGSTCQQNSQNNSEKKGIPIGINLNSRPVQNGISSQSTSSSHTNSAQNNNKENSTAASSSSNNSSNCTNTIFNYLVNPSAALPPSRLNNINVFRIKKQQSSTRNSFIQQNHPSSLSNIPQTNQTNTSQSINGQFESKNNIVVPQYPFKPKQNLSDDEDDLSIDRNNTSTNNISSSNIHSVPTNQSKLRKKTSITVQTPFTPNQLNKQESSQLERNSSKNISSSRYIQINRNIVSAQRPPKSSTKANNTALNNNNNITNSTNLLKGNSNNSNNHHAKRNSEKYSTNLLYAQSHWSPEASIFQQDDISLDQFQISTNRSQSSQNRPNKFHNSNSADNKKEIIKGGSKNENLAHHNSEINQNLIKSYLQLKEHKNNNQTEVLKMLNSSEIKPIYWKTSTIDSIANSDYDRNILIIKAENLLFGGFTSQAYWDKKENQGVFNQGSSNLGGMINFNGINSSYSSSSINTPFGINNSQGDIYGNKLNEIKRILRTLSKHYLIFLLFNSCSKKVRDLVSYMIKTNFTFDGAYYIYSPQANSVFSNKSVNLQQIIIDYKLANQVNKVIVFDAVPANFQVSVNQNSVKRNNARTPTHSTTQKKRNLSYQPTRSKSGVINVESEPYLYGGEPKDEEVEVEDGDDDNNKEEKQNSNFNTYKLKKEIHFDLLQEFIPKFEDKIIEKTKVILFKQRINPNLLQANQKKVLEVALSFVDPRVKSFSNNLYFANLDISDITAKAFEEGALNHRKRNFLKQINKIKQQNKNTKEIIEQDGDKMAENFRNRLIEYMKSTHKSIHNLYYLVGDLVMRNRNIFQKYYSDPFHCKRKNVDNLLQLDNLRYKPFPQLFRQNIFRGKQAQDYTNLIKKLPQQNPYDILFFPEDDKAQDIEESESNKSIFECLSVENIEEGVDKNFNKDGEDIKNDKEMQEKSLKNKNKSKKNFFLPINMYICLEYQI